MVSADPIDMVCRCDLLLCLQICDPQHCRSGGAMALVSNFQIRMTYVHSCSMFYNQVGFRQGTAVHFNTLVQIPILLQLGLWAVATCPQIGARNSSDISLRSHRVYLRFGSRVPAARSLWWWRIPGMMGKIMKGQNETLNGFWISAMRSRHKKGSSFLLTTLLALPHAQGYKRDTRIVLLWLEPPLANDFCNFLNKIAKIMKVFVEVDFLKSYQPLCQC